MFGDEAYTAIVDVMRIRDQLRPYVMEQYRAAAADGTPVMRPLFFDFHPKPPVCMRSVPTFSSRCWFLPASRMLPNCGGTGALG